MGIDTNHQPQTNANNRNQRLLTLLQEISLAVAQSETIDSAFAEVLSHICRFMDWPLAHVYIWSEAANALVSSRIWYMADASTIAPFRELSEATQFHRGEGTLGYVWETGESITILDVHDSSIIVREMPAEEEGVRAYFAFPVMINGGVMAVLEFFSPESVPPDPDMTSVINHVSALLGLAWQKQQTVAQLRQSETQLAEAQRTAHIGHWEWDIINNEIAWSPELYRIYGLTPDNFTATYENFLELIHPDDLEYVQFKIEDAYQNGRSFDYFHRIVRSDKTVRVIHARGRPVYDQAGSIVKLLGTAQDMTELKETELKLALSVRQLSALVEIGQAIASTLDLEQIYHRVLTLVRPLINAEALLLFLYDDKDEVLEVIAADHNDAQFNVVGTRVSPDKGILGDVWHSGQALLLQGKECVDRIAPELEQMRGYVPQALLAVPVRWQEQAVGILEATQSNASAFTEGIVPLMETIAAWTAIAIANARQYKQLQRRLSESDALVSISHALTETLELDELLQLIVTQAQKIITNADWAAIHLLQSKTNHLELAAKAGLDLGLDEYRIEQGEGIAGQVIANGGVLNIADVQIDARRLPVDLSTQARSLLVAPVESRLRRIGTISVQCATPATFTTDDERLLTVLGVQIGMAIENARLFAIQRRARERAERQRERMRQMAQRVVHAQEAERARIARELHDESGQSLTSLKISLDLIRSALPESLSDIRQSLDDVLELTDKTMSNLRLLSHNLRPPGLDVYGLDAALAGLCQDFETHTHLKIIYNGEELTNLEELTSLSLYRFAQEALTNAAKHAEATEVQVTLAQDSDMITLQVADNGCGFSPPELDEDAPKSGAGLPGMMERLEMVNGRMQIKSSPEQGSVVTAVVPYVVPEET
ncbi:MAG: hypothetical protein CL608_14300 [Anaerolineaceae bacterium]|nr:hypothetical protein [Anaerolineaceae bacterium]